MTLRASTEARVNTKAPLLRLVFGLVVAKAEVVTHRGLERPEVQRQAGFEDFLGVEAVDNALRRPHAGLVGSVTFRSWVQLGQEQDVVAGPGKRCISALDVRRHLVLDLAGKAITDTLGVGRFLEHMSDPSVSSAPFELYRDMATGKESGNELKEVKK